jgi:hypothetical protein
VDAVDIRFSGAHGEDVMCRISVMIYYSVLVRLCECRIFCYMSVCTDYARAN